jgi:hypothetical protein
MVLWLAVWCAFAVCVSVGPSAERKALYRALMRSVWTWAGLILSFEEQRLRPGIVSVKATE